LVDELHIILGPSVLAGGTPAFEHAIATRLTLLEARRLPNSQLVLLRYAPATASR
jgi:hypothetical protein